MEDQAIKTRAGGPIVWRGMDQSELDAAYDQSVYAPNMAEIARRRDESNVRARARIGAPERLAYGESGIERLDVYRTAASPAPILIFIHGGAWRNGSAAQAAFMAECFVKAGAHFVALDFLSVDDAEGDIGRMVEQARRGVRFVHRHAREIGGHPSGVYLCGHSSGAHLSGCVAITDWPSLDAPPDLLAGVLLSSGMYDLEPVRLSKRSRYVAFTDAMVEELSPIRHIGKIAAPLVLSHGTLETPEFQRQTRDFHAALNAAGKAAELIVGDGYNHFEIQETLGNPHGLLGHAALRMMKLA